MFKKAFHLLLTFPISCLAMSWFKAGSVGRNGDLQGINGDRTFPTGGDAFSDLTEQDAIALRINMDALNAYSHKPDCFKSVVAARIKGPCTESDMDQDARVSAAISMTLCEVATASHYSVPLECRLFSTDADAKKTGSVKTSQAAQGDCVDALSRSAQLWSSFSGYMREIPQLCHAFRRWNDIDLARNIYYNVTVEKIALMRFILAREKTSAQSAEAMLQRSMEMKDITKDMKAHQERLQVYASEFIMTMQNTFEEVATKFWQASSEVASVREASDVAAAARLEAMLMGVVNSQSLALGQSLDLLLPPVASRLNEVLSTYEIQVGRVDATLGRTASKLFDLEMGFGEMQGAFLRIVANAEQVSKRLDDAAQYTQSIRASQEETKTGASALASALAGMANATSFELDRLNHTLHGIGEQLHVQLGRDAYPWKHAVIRALELIYRDPGSLASVEQLFSFKLLLTVLGFGWTALRAACSVAAALATLCFLGTRRIFLSRKSVEDMGSYLALLETSEFTPPPDYKWQRTYTPMSAFGYSPASADARTGHLNAPLRGSESIADRQAVPGRRKRVSRIPERLWNPPN